jgi:ectoine hydroxylase-related dioxygenase (phytanoyl-CoA dioxygenase family)
MALSLSAAQRAQIDDDGFTVLERVFSPETMDALSVAIEGYEARHREALTGRGGTAGISRAEEITFTDHLAEQDPAIRAFCERPEFVALTTALLGPDIDLYWNQAVFKMPEGEKPFPWHQDDGYTPVTPSPYLTLWVALNDATVENGCVWVLPGSHKRGLVPHENTPIGLACHSLDDPDQGVPVPVPAGSIVAFWSLTMHKSGVNRSPGARKAYIVQYCRHGLRRLPSQEIVPDLIPIARAGQRASS